MLFRSEDISWQSVTTGSTLTAVAGNGYPIDTTSNTCTITLPASASVGDQIMFTDYDRTWGTYEIIIDSNGLNYQGEPDTSTVEYSTDGQSLHIVYMDATNGWIPISDDDVTFAPSKNKGIFAYGNTGSYTAVSNLVSDQGVVATDVTGVGTVRIEPDACEYGGDKGIFGFGYTPGGVVGMTNLVTSSGVIGSDVAAVGQTRRDGAGCSYGSDKGIMGFGYGPGVKYSLTNLISSSGVVASDTTGVGTARYGLAACEFGGDKGIFGFGLKGTSPDVGDVRVSTTNLVSNAGVVATDTTGVPAGRASLAACSYGEDKGIFGFGTTGSLTGVTNLVSNAGVVATDTTGVGTARQFPAATQYGGDKAIFGFGTTGSVVGYTNLVTNAGVVGTDVTAVGTARSHLGACSYGP